MECRGRKPNHCSLNALRTGGVYCSLECRDTVIRDRRARVMATTNRRYASERMKRSNPMRNPVTRAKMRTTLRSIQWIPPVRGGNGGAPSAAQMLLASTLGWEMEVPVPTKQPRHSGYPTCYKLDIGNRELMIAVEVDGKSHCSIERQAQDRKKEALLRSLGWKVLRFTNAEVIRNLNGCVQEVRSSISK